MERGHRRNERKRNARGYISRVRGTLNEARGEGPGILTVDAKEPVPLSLWCAKLPCDAPRPRAARLNEGASER